jgi:hypothetical protein
MSLGAGYQVSLSQVTTTFNVPAPAYPAAADRQTEPKAQAQQDQAILPT